MLQNFLDLIFQWEYTGFYHVKLNLIYLLADSSGILLALVVECFVNLAIKIKIKNQALKQCCLKFLAFL